MPARKRRSADIEFNDAADFASPCESGWIWIFGNQQVFDLPEPEPLVVTEHRAHDCRCPACGAKTRAAFPDGVNAPVQYGTRIGAFVLIGGRLRLARSLFGPLPRKISRSAGIQNTIRNRASSDRGRRCRRHSSRGCRAWRRRDRRSAARWRRYAAMLNPREEGLASSAQSPRLAAALLVCRHGCTGA